ncbi:MAG: hypothetical protein PHF86_09150 [Candidatus Nanoarchaeia archaeon]|nr:hypothetical protein [Candidatus Nanoarchaeia archaeon]
MNKKGDFEKEYIILFYLVLAIIVGGIILTFVSRIKDDTSFKMKQVAIDSAFLIDSISAAPFDLNVKASFAEENLFLNFKSNPCIIESYPKDRTNPYQYYCFSNLNIENKEIETLFINFKKQNNKVIIEK